MPGEHALGTTLVADAGAIAAAWVERMLAADGSGFTHRPQDEVRRTCEVYVTDLGHYLLHRDERALRVGVAKEAARRCRIRFPVADLVTAYRVLQDLLWERVGREGTSESAGPALWDLGGAIAVSIEETVKEYQRLLAQQIAAHQREMDELSRQIQQSASIDDLTGLFTVRVLNEYLPREVQRARRYQHLVSLVIFDVDDFSRLVDQSGTFEGDRVLKELAQIVPGRVREVDIMCRLDVDEFAVILPETPIAHAVTVAERIRAAAESHAFFAPELRASGAVRISAGVAGCPDDASTAEDLVERARQACRHAKELGKNHVAVYAESQT